ncbi:MAG: glucans biosynthesis glucosyltransferase MdoH [Planctomycetota bacterium]
MSVLQRGVLGCAAVILAFGLFAFVSLCVDDESFGLVDLVATVLFTLLFGWISLSFSLSIAAALAREEAPPRKRDLPSRVSSTALVMPIYNESPVKVFSGIAAIREQLEEHGKRFSGSEPSHPSGHGTFDFYLLSDTTDVEKQREEQRLIARVQALAPNVYYRHRTDNHQRKAGNIADFCEHWGDAYDFMIILDADSLMSAGTITQLVARIQADEQLGILQAPPSPIGRSSVFARVQQFASAVYGPLFTRGLALFSGDHGNYWGHNAIIRVAAFKQCCHLPVLRGFGALGGEILSHDFVEAALMVRNGWKVRLAEDLGGSFEECPTTVRDYAKRDQRWCQGNLQHWKIALAEGFHPMSRFHLVSGILAYAMSPIWMLFLVIMGFSCFWIQQAAKTPEPRGFGNVSWLGWSHTSLSLCLFIAAMMMLFLPKILAVAMLMRRADSCLDHGGRLRLFCSFLLESLLSVLFAPVNALHHTRFLLGACLGRHVGWGAQQRSENRIRFSDAARDGIGFTVLGCVLGILIYRWQPSALPWLAPVLAGWTLSIPLLALMASTLVGRGLQRMGLLLIAQETQPEPIWEAQQAWMAFLGPTAVTKRAIE